MPEEQTYSQGMTAEQVTAQVEARVQGMVDEASRRAVAAKAEISTELAEVEGWWNLWAIGPFQRVRPGGPLYPDKIIKVGEDFYVSTVLWLSPFFIFPGGVSPCQLISNLACDFEIDFCTADMCKWAPASQFSPKGVKVALKPNQCYYVLTQRFRTAPGMESCLYEMNICARITGCEGRGGAPPLAGYVSAVYDLDPDLFYPRPPTPGPTPSPGARPRWKFDIPIRFQIY